MWREVLNNLDGEAGPELPPAIEEHVDGCKRCAAVLDGTRNVIELYGDEHMREVPLGFTRRLHQRLEGNMPSRRRFFGWMVATAAGVLVAGGFEAGRCLSGGFNLKSEHARSTTQVPPDMTVIVSEDGKTFHGTSKCPFIHDKSRLQTISAGEAEQQGYAPCVRCMSSWLLGSRS